MYLPAPDASCSVYSIDKLLRRLSAGSSGMPGSDPRTPCRSFRGQAAKTPGRVCFFLSQCPGVLSAITFTAFGNQPRIITCSYGTLELEEQTRTGRPALPQAKPGVTSALVLHRDGRGFERADDPVWFRTVRSSFRKDPYCRTLSLVRETRRAAVLCSAEKGCPKSLLASVPHPSTQRLCQ